MTSILDKMNRDMRAQENILRSDREKKQSFIPFNKLVESEENSKIYIVKPDLVDTIKEHGLRESFTVRRLNDGKFEILSGNRRYVSFKKILDEDPDFRYLWVQGNKYYSPLTDGIPCKIIENELGNDEATEITLTSNKHRDYDKLEIYRVVMKWKEYYSKEGFEGRLNEKIAENAPVSARTIADILTNKWIINNQNFAEVEECGSWEEYCKQKAENITSEKASMPKPKMNDFNKEYAYQDKIQTHHEKLDFDKLDIKGEYYDDLRKNAVKVIRSIMDVYNLSEKDIRE